MPYVNWDDVPKFNYNWDDNANPKYRALVCDSAQEVFKYLIHPPVILPISCRLDWGIDFLGYIVLPHYILPRTKTKRRIFKKLTEKIDEPNFNQSLQSYLGYLSHANSFKIKQQLLGIAYFLPFC